MGSEKNESEKTRKKSNNARRKNVGKRRMDFVEIKEWMNDRIRGGITSAWLGNILAKSGIFVQTGETRVEGIGYNYVVKVYDSKRRQVSGFLQAPPHPPLQEE